MEKYALLPGGFKPPHAGHYDMAKWLANNTDADTVIVKVGPKVRDGIDSETSIALWNLYRETDNDPAAKKLTILPTKLASPVSDVYDFIENTAEEGSTIYLGMGEKDETDSRFKNVPKFAEPRNIKFQTVLVPPQAGGVSGTQMRNFIKNGDEGAFKAALPNHLDPKEQDTAWKLVSSVIVKETFSSLFNEYHQNLINEDIKDYGHVKEYNLDLTDSYNYSNNGDFWVFYDDVNDLGIYVKLKANRGYKEFKFYPDPQSGIGFGKLKHHNPKNLNTVFNIFLNEVLPNNPKVLIQPADNIRYRLFKALINNNLSQDDYNVYLSNNDDPVDGSPKIIVTQKTPLKEETTQGKTLFAFDLDDTLITSKSNVIIRDKETGEVKKLTPAQYATYVPQPNDDIDFSEFAQLINPQVLSQNFQDFAKVLRGASQGNNKAIILTARQPEVSDDVHELLKNFGLSTITVHAVGSSDPQAKVDVLRDYIESGYKNVRFYDDARKNVIAVQALDKEYPGVTILAKLIKGDKGLLEFAGGVMNSQELKKHKSNLSRLQKVFAKQGDKIIPVPDFLMNTLRTKLYEDISSGELDAIEAYADKLFAKYNVDVEFTKHFAERVNDARNDKPISKAELIGLFKKAHKRYGKSISQKDDGFEAVLNDISKELNLPFVLRYDARNDELDLITKTIMRKKDFKSTTPKLPLEEIGEGSSKPFPYTTTALSKGGFTSEIEREVRSESGEKVLQKIPIRLVALPHRYLVDEDYMDQDLFDFFNVPEGTFLNGLDITFIRKGDVLKSFKAVNDRVYMFRLMATVKEILQKEFAKSQPDYITYSPSKEEHEEFGTASETGRHKLYNAFIQKAFPNAKSFENLEDEEIIYKLKETTTLNEIGEGSSKPFPYTIEKLNTSPDDFAAYIKGEVRNETGEKILQKIPIILTVEALKGYTVLDFEDLFEEHPDLSDYFNISEDSELNGFEIGFDHDETVPSSSRKQSLSLVNDRVYMFRLMATIKKILQKAFAKSKPNFISYTPHSTREKNPTQKSINSGRHRLYKAFIQKAFPNAKPLDNSYDDEIIWFLDPNPTLNEAVGYRAGRINPNTPQERLKDRAFHLVRSKVGVLGTGHYFYGDEGQAKKSVKADNRSGMTTIDLDKYKMFKPSNPELFYKNIQDITLLVRDLIFSSEVDYEDEQTQNQLGDLAKYFQQEIGISEDDVFNAIQLFIDDISAKRDGLLLANHLLKDYDGIDNTGTSLDNFAVGSLIFDGKLKQDSYSLTSADKLEENMKEATLFSKEWWMDVIQEMINEGGAAGHMAHPFDLPNVKTGQDLIKSFEASADSLKNEPGSVKIDGVNSSVRLIDRDGKKQFAMDRGSKKELDLKGVTKDDLEARFGAGHGMIKAGSDVLDILNAAIPATKTELEKLGMLDDPNIIFNMEYVEGKTNVQDYDKNFLAIHGLLKTQMKKVKGKSGKILDKRVTTEIPYDKAALDAYIEKIAPIANKQGFEVYGSVPTTFTKEPNFNKALNKRYTIEFTDKKETKTLRDWLKGVTSIPKTDRLKMNLETGGVKDVGALSKQVYFAVFGGENIDDLFDSEQDIQKAIQGATTYLATEKLGDEILDVLDSPMGSVNDHEGVVIRDTKISQNPFKITGKFITGGVASNF